MKLQCLITPNGSLTPVLFLEVDQNGNFDFQDGNLTTTGDITGYAPKESHINLLALATEHAFS